MLYLILLVETVTTGHFFIMVSLSLKLAMKNMNEHKCSTSIRLVCSHRCKLNNMLPFKLTLKPKTLGTIKAALLRMLRLIETIKEYKKIFSDEKLS